MQIVLVSHTRFAKYFDCIVGKIIAFWRNVSDKIRVSVDASYTRMPVITLAFMPRSLKNFLFHSIVERFDYSHHTNTSNLLTVLIDANHRLAYPLAKRLEDRADGARIPKSNDKNDE